MMSIINLLSPINLNTTLASSLEEAKNLTLGPFFKKKEGSKLELFQWAKVVLDSLKLILESLGVYHILYEIFDLLFRVKKMNEEKSRVWSLSEQQWKNRIDLSGHVQGVRGSDLRPSFTLTN